MLRGMGFDNTTSIYLASGKIYWAEKHLAPLLKMFPYLHTKESLATPDELAPFKVSLARFQAMCSQESMSGTFYFGIFCPKCSYTLNLDSFKFNRITWLNHVKSVENKLFQR